MKLLAVDGNNLLMRALHATKRSAMTAHGVPTGPLLVFVNSLAKHLREEGPTHLGVAWDGAGAGYRHLLDPEYKANRREAPDAEHELKQSSFALAREFCRLAGIHQLGYDGVEADDIIAAWWLDWVRIRGREMVILSSDKDLLQLVDRPEVTQVRLSSADAETDRWTAERVQGYFGVPSRTVPALLAIAGDSSDNVKGVRGIGPKKGAKALRDAELDFERCVLTNWPEQANQLNRNYRLVDLRGGWRSPEHARPEAPPETTSPALSEAARADLVRFLEQYEMTSVLTRMREGGSWFDTLFSTRPSPMVGRPLYSG